MGRFDDSCMEPWYISVNEPWFTIKVNDENIYGNNDEDLYCLPPSEEEELYGQLEQHKILKIPRHEIQ